MSGNVPDYYWKNLLALTTKVSADETGTTSEADANTPPKQMTAEDRKWLEEMMKTLVDDTDIGRQMQRAIDGLKKLATSVEHTEEDLAHLEDYALRLDDLVQFADLSPFFIRSGGLVLIDRFVHFSRRPDIQVVFGDMIRTVAENNPPAQEALLEYGMIGKIIDMVKNRDLPEELRIKMISAASAAVRSHYPSYDEFVNLGGPFTFTQLVADKDNSLKLAAKAARVLVSIAFTLADSPDRMKPLNQNCIRNYITLSARNNEGEVDSELEYLRDYLKECVDSEELEYDGNLRKEVVETLRTELGRGLGAENEAIIQDLVNKYSPTTTG